VNRCREWMEQAKTDLDDARKSLGMGDFGWACFVTPP